MLLVEKMLSNQEDYSIDKAGIFPKVHRRKRRENSPKLQKEKQGMDIKKKVPNRSD